MNVTIIGTGYVGLTTGATIKAHDPIATPHAHAQHPDLPASLHTDIDDLAKGCDAVRSAGLTYIGIGR